MTPEQEQLEREIAFAADQLEEVSRIVESLRRKLTRLKARRTPSEPSEIEFDHLGHLLVEPSLGPIEDFPGCLEEPEPSFFPLEDNPDAQ